MVKFDDIIIMRTGNSNKVWLLTATLENWRIAQDKGIFGVHGNRAALNKVKTGDLFIAYVPAIGFVGRGKVTGSPFESKIRLWKDRAYNHRFQISTPVLSDRVVPAPSIVDDLSFVTDKKYWKGFFKSGLREIPQVDAEEISRRLTRAIPVLHEINEDLESKVSTTQIGTELHDRVFDLFTNLGFNIIDSNYTSAGPDLTVVDPEAKNGGKIIIQCKNSKQTEKATFDHLDKTLYEYSGRLKSAGANAAVMVIAGHRLPKRIPGEKGELDLEDVLERYGVAVWTEETLSYYEKLIDKISHFARYQVLSDLGMKLNFGLDISADAIKIDQNGSTFYAASLHPDWLLRSVSVVRRVRAGDGPRGYQRLLDKNRVAKTDKITSIANYLDTTPNWLFPNAIVLASSRYTNLNFSDGTLELKSQYGQFWVIDGQHRLFAFANAEARKSDSNVLCVIIDSKSLGSVHDEERELAQVFVTLNGKAKKVSKALLYELYELLGSKDNPSLEVVLKLAEQDFFAECIRGYTDKVGSINLVAFADAKGTENIYKYFLLSNKAKNKDQLVDMTAKYILAAFEIVADLFPDQWKNPDEYFLKTDRGVKGILVLLAQILNRYGSNLNDATRILTVLRDCNFDFSSETAKGMYLGAGGPDQLALSFTAHINKNEIDFAPEYSGHRMIAGPVLSEWGAIDETFLKEWIGKLEGEVRCHMIFIDDTTAKYLSYLNPSKVKRARMFFGNCNANPHKVKESINKLREGGLNIVLTQSQKRTAHKGSFIHARWIGDDKLQIRTEVDLQDSSQKGATFHIYVDSWKNSPENGDFDRYWYAAEMNRDVLFGFDWTGGETE